MKFKPLIIFLMTCMLVVLMILMIMDYRTSEPLTSSQSYGVLYQQAPWNMTASYYVLKTQEIKVHVDYSGSVKAVLVTYDIHGSIERFLLLNHTLNASEAINDAGVFHSYENQFRFSTARNVTLHVFLNKPKINESNYNELQLYMVQVKFSYNIEVHSTQNFLPTPIFMLLLLSLLSGLFMLANKEKLWQQRTKKEERNVKTNYFRYKKSKEFSDKVFLDYLFMLLPNSLFLGIFLFGFLLPITFTIKLPVGFPLTPFSFVQLFFLESWAIVIGIFLLIEISLGLYGFLYISKEYEHYWSYPNSRKWFYVQIVLLNSFTYLTFGIIYGSLVIGIYGYLLLGLPILSIVNLGFIGIILLHVFLLIAQTNIIITIAYKTQSEVNSLIISVTGFYVLEFIMPGDKLLGLTHNSLFNLWKASNYMKYYGVMFGLFVVFSYYVLWRVIMTTEVRIK